MAALSNTQYSAFVTSLSKQQRATLAESVWTCVRATKTFVFVFALFLCSGAEATDTSKHQAGKHYRLLWMYHKSVCRIKINNPALRTLEHNRGRYVPVFPVHFDPNVVMLMQVLRNYQPWVAGGHPETID